MPCVRVGQGRTYAHEEQALGPSVQTVLGPWELEDSTGSPAPGKKQLFSAKAASPELISALCTQEAQSVNAFHSVNTGTNAYVAPTQSTVNLNVSSYAKKPTENETKIS